MTWEPCSLCPETSRSGEEPLSLKGCLTCEETGLLLRNRAGGVWLESGIPLRCFLGLPCPIVIVNGQINQVGNEEGMVTTTQE